MKKIILKSAFCFVCLLLVSLKISFAQTKLVLNGGVINITNGCNLVLANDSSNAIIRYDGHIVTEGEENIIMWHIKQTVGTYTVPFGTADGNYIPVSFNTNDAVGNGYFNLSTYPTGWQNSALLPQGVTNLVYPGIDNSDLVIDRFWQIDAKTYTTKPDLNNLKFSYLNEDHLDSNRIVESDLKAITWNSKNSTWNDFQSNSIIDTDSNIVNVPAVADTNLYKWWTLLSKSSNPVSALPITLLDFNAECDQGKTKLVWSTASENNNQFFTLENSIDGFNWNEIVKMDGSNTTNIKKEYSYFRDSITSQLNYYRLKQTDINGKYSYSEIIKNVCEYKMENVLTVFPNPSNGVFNVNVDLMGKVVNVQNSNGQIVSSQTFNQSSNQINLDNLADGVYTLKVEDQIKKIIISR